MVSMELSKNLRARFPELTVKRLDAMWEWVVKMPRGVVDPRTLELDAFSAEDLLACLHLARELEYRNSEQLQKIIRQLSAHGKRTAFPRSYAPKSLDRPTAGGVPCQPVKRSKPIN